MLLYDNLHYYYEYTTIITTSATKIESITVKYLELKNEHPVHIVNEFKNKMLLLLYSITTTIIIIIRILYIVL